MKVKANGTNFNCDISGRDGAPWVMLSNSLATNFSMWDGQAAALAPDYRVLRYDQRGHGGDVVSLALNITSTVRYEEQLKAERTRAEAANRAKSAFLAKIGRAHV